MSRIPPSINPDWSPGWLRDLMPPPAEVPRASQITEGERNDKVLYGPKGEVLVRHVDRPFMGYRK